MKLVNDKIKAKFVGKNQIHNWQDGVILSCLRKIAPHVGCKVINRPINPRTDYLRSNIAKDIKNEISQ